MMLPTIHLNGTGRQTLKQEYVDAWNAVQAAKKALQQVTVHGRDYYPQGPHAYSQARHEQDDRLKALDKIAEELLEIAIKIDS